MAVRLVLRAGAALLPINIFGCLILISVSVSVRPRAMLRQEGLGKLKIFSDLFGTRTNYLPGL
jgi:hypothetical protein